MKSQTNHTSASSLLLSPQMGNLLKFVLAVGLMVFVVSKTNLQNILVLKDQLSWSWLLAGLIFFCLATIAKGFQYWLLLDGKVSFRNTIKVVIIQNALTNFVANTAGIATLMAMFKLEQNVGLRRSGLIFLLTKASDLLAMVFFLWLSSFQVWDRIESLQKLVISLLMVACGGLVIFWVAVFFRQKFVAQIKKLIHWLHVDRISVVQRGVGILDALVDQERETILLSLFKGTFVSFIYMMLIMAYSYARFRVFPIPADLWAIIFITFILQFISIVPIQIFGGLGVSELTLVYLFSHFGVVQVDIPAILVALRVLFYLFQLVVMVYIPFNGVLNRLNIQKIKKIG